jgi:hypothetical protein
MASKRPRSKSLAGALFAGVVLLVSTILVFTPPVSSSATSGSGVEPVFVEDNPSCSSLGYAGFELKVEPVSSGNYSDGTLSVSITVVATPTGQTFDWSSNLGVDAVIAKGGPDANVYEYTPPATADTGLHAPLGAGPGGTQYFGLSHISFCYRVPVVGSFEVTKQVTGETDGYVPGSKFTVAYDCDDGTSGSFVLADGETDGVGTLPVGTTCALSEIAKPATSGPSYGYGTESWDPSNVVIIEENQDDNVVAVLLTNPIDRVLGSFEVTKQVTGATDGYVPGSEFTVAYDCDDGTDGTLQLIDGESKSVTGLLLGTTCTLSETAKPATSGPSYVYGTESWDPSNVVIIDSTTKVSVALENPIERRLGSFEVTKQVTGETDGYVPGSKFTVAYDCDDGTDGTLVLADGETDGVGGLPVGTTCTLSETAKPATSGPSYVYGTESWDPSNVVSIDSTTKVSVALTNPIDRIVGGFTVTKQVTGETDGYVPGSEFTVSFDCDDGTAGTLVLADGETDGVGDLPLGTACTLSEIAKPATSGPSYVYGPESWDPSDVVIVSKPGGVSAVVLTNPIERLFGGFTVTKQVTGETDGYVPGSTFTVSYLCDDGTEGTLELLDGGTDGVGGLLVGTTCLLDETAKPAPSGPSYVYGPESWDPSNVVLIEENDSDDVVSVVLTNPLDRLLGSIEVTKVVTGATAGQVPGSVFGFELDCDDDAFDQSFTLEAGDTASVTGVPVGTSCTVSEVSVPDPVQGYEYSPPALVPADGTVQVGSTTEPVTVLVENPLVDVPEPIAQVVTPPAEVGGVQQVPQEGTLPVTGAHVAGLLAAALGLLAGGAALVRRSRRTV